MEEQIKTQDKSGDKEFFTIIPNYIPNHSTANDQALYLQMKKITGEDGKCFATEKTLMKKLGIGKKAFDKSLNYLLKKRWITYIGLTEGKTRPIKTYRINNIWKLNIDYYKKISAESNISLEKDKFQKEEDKFQKQHKISAKSNIEEEPIKEEPIIRVSNADGVVDINKLIELFKPINPSYERLFSNKTQRAAFERLVKKYGEEKIIAIIEALPDIINKPYAPRITTPYELEKDLGKLIVFFNQEKGKVVDKSKIKSVRV